MSPEVEHACPVCPKKYPASSVQPPWARSEAIIDKARRNMEKLREIFRT